MANQNRVSRRGLLAAEVSCPVLYRHGSLQHSNVPFRMNVCGPQITASDVTRNTRNGFHATIV